MSVPDPEKQPVMDLPAPVDPTAKKAEKAADGPEIVRQQGTERNPELLPTTVKGAPGSLPAPTATATPTAAPTADPAAPAAQASTASNAMPQIADDIDLIEKEWVEKAKAIVAQTKDDPRTQSMELDKVKTEYRKKRFNTQAPADMGK